MASSPVKGPTGPIAARGRWPDGSAGTRWRRMPPAGRRRWRRRGVAGRLDWSPRSTAVPCLPSTLVSWGVDGLPELIRSRRTHKSFGPEPVAPDVLDELLELARWAPNHHRTNPWRFRVMGPETLARLKEAAGPAEAPKLDRAPTLVVASAVLSGDLQQDEEDICATASAILGYIISSVRG